MKCPSCGADILEDIRRCPFCKHDINKKPVSSGNRNTPSGHSAEDEFDFTYTITAKDQIDLIRQAVSELEKGEGKRKAAQRERHTLSENFEADLRRIRQESSPETLTYRSKKPKADETILQEDSSKFSKKTDGQKRANRHKRKLRINLPRLTLLLLCVIVAVAAVAGGISMAVSRLASSAPEENRPLFYTKGNQLLQYDGHTAMTLTGSVFLAEESVPEDTTDGENTGQTENPAVDLSMVQASENGRYTYYFENFDTANNSGDLYMVKDSKEDTKVKVASAVHNSLVLSEDGSKVLFIQNGNYDGNMGTLMYWREGFTEARRIASDMDHANFVFSQDENQALFVERFNTTSHTGDLCYIDLTEEDAEKVKIDSDVAAVFGTDYTGKVFIYAQNYNPADYTYDIYTKTVNTEKRRIADHAALSPVISKHSAQIYLYGALENGTHNLYLSDLQKNTTERIASGVSGIVKVSEDENNVLYFKAYSNGLADYYIYTKGKDSQKIANSVNTFSQTEHAQVPQFAISDDFSQIAYISEFDPAKERGALYRCGFRGGTVTEAEKISDEAYACTVSADGQEMWYAANFSTGRKMVEIYCYSRGENTMIEPEVLADKFNFGKEGNTIIYLSDFNEETGYGRLVTADSSGNKTQILEDAAAYGLKTNGDIIALKEYNQTDKTFDLYYADSNGTAPRKLDSGVTSILLY